MAKIPNPKCELCEHWYIGDGCIYEGDCEYKLLTPDAPAVPVGEQQEPQQVIPTTPPCHYVLTPKGIASLTTAGLAAYERGRGIEGVLAAARAVVEGVGDTQCTGAHRAVLIDRLDTALDAMEEV